MTPYREAQFDAPTSIERRWGIAAVAMVLLVAGLIFRLPVPGADAVEHALAREPPGTTPLDCRHWHSPFWWVVLYVVRAALALATDGRGEALRRRVSALGAVAFALIGASVECARFIDEALPRLIVSGASAVPHGFLAGLFVARAAGLAALWGLASMVTRSRVAHGPSLLGCGVLGLFAVERAWGYGRGAERGAIEGDLEASLVFTGFAVVLFVCLWRATPTAWPRRVLRGVEAFSAVDLVPPAVLGAAAAGASADAVRGLLSGPQTSAVRMAPNVASLVGALLASLLMVRALRRGGSMRRSHASLGVALTLLAALGVAVLGGTVDGARRRSEPWSWPWPSTGRWHEVTLASPFGDGAHDAPLIARRIVAAGHRAEVVRARRGAITLRVALLGGDLWTVAAWASRRGLVGMHALASEQLVAAPVDASSGVVQAPVGDSGVSAPRAADWESISRYLRPRLSADDHGFRVGCVDVVEWRRCFALRVEPTPAARLQPLQGSTALSRGPTTGRVVVRVPLTPAMRDGVRVAQARGPVALVVDEMVLNVLHLRDVVVDDHSLYIDASGIGPEDDELRNAHAFATLIDVGPLDARWTVMSPESPSR